MIHAARIALVIALCAAGPGVGRAQDRGDPPVRVHVDVHVPVPVPVFEVPATPEPAPEPRHHHPPPRRGDEPPPPPPRSGWNDPEPPHRGGHDDFHVPPDRVPSRGLCRIWYDDLPPDRQPPPMSCERAHHVARHRGGRVIWAESHRAHEDGRVASAQYGAVDFRGVPPDRLPPPGSCRVWLEGVPPDRQPPPTSCERAEHDARRTGGRVLYMPGP